MFDARAEFFGSKLWCVSKFKKEYDLANPSCFDCL